MELESDKELKGLNFEDYRRLKRQKMRKRVGFISYVWEITPSPPRNEYVAAYENQYEAAYEKERESDGSKQKSNSKSRKKHEEDVSKESDSEIDKSRKRKTYKSRPSIKKSLSGTDSDSEEEEEDRKRRRKKSNNKRKSSRNSNRKKTSNTRKRSKDSSDADDLAKLNKHMEPEKILNIDEKSIIVEEVMMVGPQAQPKGEGHMSYGGALRPGEGDAIAQYVQQGKRIPRRGEVGLSANEISRFEDLGYVMSGSRHQRMNAIRIRKENQVYSAEDKRDLAMFNYDEKAKRESKVMADLLSLVERHVMAQDTHHLFGHG